MGARVVSALALRSCANPRADLAWDSGVLWRLTSGKRHKGDGGGQDRAPRETGPGRGEQGGWGWIPGLAMRVRMEQGQRVGGLMG